MELLIALLISLNVIDAETAKTLTPDQVKEFEAVYSDKTDEEYYRHLPLYRADDKEETDEYYRHLPLY